MHGASSMCGIFGFSGFVEKGLLARMARSLVHRGPDGEGFYEDEAHRFIQKASMDKNKPQREIAEAILIAEDLTD